MDSVQGSAITKAIALLHHRRMDTHVAENEPSLGAIIAVSNSHVTPVHVADAWSRGACVRPSVVWVLLKWGCLRAEGSANPLLLLLLLLWCAYVFVWSSVLRYAYTCVCRIVHAKVRVQAWSRALDCALPPCVYRGCDRSVRSRRALTCRFHARFPMRRHAVRRTCAWRRCWATHCTA
jgi:hypothetical protein